MATNPGLHTSARIDRFTHEERAIVENLARYFYVTGGDEILVGGARYAYATVRPSHIIEHALPNAREFLVLFSGYEDFEARTLHGFSDISAKYHDLRINNHFRILLSKDPNIADKMRKICEDEPDIPVTLPFTYDSLLSAREPNTIVDATRANYHFRDLFSQRDPLRDSTFFYGRATLLASLRDRMSRGENAGVFGLRKSGKTSILLACERLARTDGHRFIHIDCQNGSTTSAKWNELLRSIAVDIRKSAGVSIGPAQLGDFSTLNAGSSFEKAVLDAYGNGKKRTVLAFDEIEHISPQTGVGHWRTGEDTLLFWQTIRSVHQRLGTRFSFLVAGTNPIITECREIYGSDNPILAYLSVDYLPGLSDTEMQHMCESLGGLMGMSFTVPAVATLYEALGGHAFLSRQIASHIHKTLPFLGRPMEVTREHVESAIKSFNFQPLFDDILSSLKARFPDEYELLEWCALGDQDKVEEFLRIDNAFAAHLVGYGLVRQRDNNLVPKMALVTEHLRASAKASGLVKSAPDRWALAAKRRGEVEVGLRLLMRNRLIDRFGRASAAQEMRTRLNKGRAEQLAACTLDDIFSPGACKLYFSDLVSLIEDDLPYWSRRLELAPNAIKPMLLQINDLRHDAHANEFTDQDFDTLLDHLDSLESVI